MSFEHLVRIPLERIGVLVGRNGKIKADLEERCKVVLSIDSKTGEVWIRSNGSIPEALPFKAIEIVTAIANGFSSEKALNLLEEEFTLSVIDLREFIGQSKNSLIRIKGRIIGLGGKARKIIEDLTDTLISVYGHKVSIIGKVEEVKHAYDAIGMLASGSPHRFVYKTLQKERTKAKLEILKLWEEEPSG